MEHSHHSKHSCHHEHHRHAPDETRPLPANASETVYTCPMHPQVRQKEPGNCPICGMALEPENIAEGEADDTELKDMTRRFWIATALSVPLVILNMGAHVSASMHDFLMNPLSAWVQLVLATPVVLWAG